VTQKSSASPSTQTVRTIAKVDRATESRVIARQNRDAVRGAPDHVTGHVEEGFPGFGPSSNPDDGLSDSEASAFRHGARGEGLVGVTIRAFVFHERTEVLRSQENSGDQFETP